MTKTKTALITSDWGMNAEVYVDGKRVAKDFATSTLAHERCKENGYETNYDDKGLMRFSEELTMKLLSVESVNCPQSPEGKE